MKFERKHPERIALHFLLGYERQLFEVHVDVNKKKTNMVHFSLKNFIFKSQKGRL